MSLAEPTEDAEVYLTAHSLRSFETQRALRVSVFFFCAETPQNKNLATLQGWA